MAFWSLLFLSALVTIAVSAYDPPAPAYNGYDSRSVKGGGVKGGSSYGNYEDSNSNRVPCDGPGCDGSGVKRPDYPARRTTTRRPRTTTRNSYTTTTRYTTTRRPYTTTTRYTTTRRPYTTTTRYTTTRRPYTTTTRRPYTTTTRKAYTTTPWRPFTTTTTRRPIFPIWPGDYDNKVEPGNSGSNYDFNPPQPPIRTPKPGIRDVDGYGDDDFGNSNDFYDVGRKDSGTKSGNSGVKYGK